MSTQQFSETFYSNLLIKPHYSSNEVFSKNIYLVNEYMYVLPQYLVHVV